MVGGREIATREEIVDPGGKARCAMVDEPPFSVPSLPSSSFSGGADTSGGEAPQVSRTNTEPTGTMPRQYVAGVPVPRA